MAHLPGRVDLDAPQTPKTDEGSDSDSGCLSVLSRSPTPPSPSFLMAAAGFPGTHLPLSPSSSKQSSKKGTPDPETGGSTDDDGAPPAKRRKISMASTDAKTEPKARTTEHLDLRAGQGELEQKQQIERLLKVLHKRRKIVVIAGAGISVSAGIPDFRSSTGLFTTLKSQHNLKSSGKDLFDASVYKDDNATSSFHQMLRSLSEQTKSAEPTPFHHLLATLAKENRLLRLYSQNVDGIDASLEPLATAVPLKIKEGKWPKTIQLHGNLDKMVCTKCHTISDFQSELFTGPVPPACPECEEHDNVRTNMAGKRSHGIGRLRPRMVLYNEHNPDDEAIGSVVRADMKTKPDALIVVGTTLKVPGVKRITREFCKLVSDRKDGGMCIWINNDPPPSSGKDLTWDLVVKGTCDRVAELASLPRYTDINQGNSQGDSQGEEVSVNDVERVRSSQEVEVRITSPSKSQMLKESHLPTPSASPHLKPKTGEIAGVPGTPTKARKSLGGPGKPRKISITLKTGKAAPKPRKNAAGAAKKGGAPSAQPNKKIAFKVSKATKAAEAAVKKLENESTGGLLDTISVSPVKKQAASRSSRRASKMSIGMPMAPISPQEARNNTSPPFGPGSKGGEEGGEEEEEDNDDSNISFGMPAIGLPKDTRSILN